MATHVRARRPAPRHLVYGLLVVFCMAAAVTLTGPYPTQDSALFEYCGRAIVRGQTMYAYVWDDKLPAIYYVNALWQTIFGERYVLHTIAQAVIAGISGLLLIRVMRKFSLPGAYISAGALVVWLCVTFPLNSTEAYALPFLLAAAGEALPLRAGIWTGIAAAFWIPSLLMVAPAFSRFHDRPGRNWAIFLCVALAIPIATTLGIAGTATAGQLVHTWVSYASASAPARIHHHFPIFNGVGTLAQALDNLRAGLLVSGVAVLLLLLLAVIRRPHTAAQSFGLLWTCAMLAGAFVGTRFFAHYFIACVPSLLFTICSYVPGLKLNGARASLAALAVWCLYTMIAIRVSDDVAQRSNIAERLARVARGVVAGRFTMAVDSFKPELYLALDPLLRSRYEIVGNSQTIPRGALGTRADLRVITRAGRPEGTTVCRRTAAPWKIYVDASLRNRFDACR